MCSAQGSNGGLVPWVMVGPKIIVQNCTRPCSSTLFNPTKISFLFLYITLCSSEKTAEFSREAEREGLKKMLSALMVIGVSSPTNHSEHICKEIIDN